jgi:hypothetical protein
MCKSTKKHNTSSQSKNHKKTLKSLQKKNIENKCNNPDNQYSKKCNEIFLQKEELDIEDTQNNNTLLYPTLTDPEFNDKIFTKKEFNDTRYDGEIFEDVKEHSNELIENSFRVLKPHQAFVKNFLSFQTPYNSLLLYHGLGSGKTCSAIGVCEESRDYLKQTGIIRKNMIVAAPNVIDNFKKQLFDENNLKEKDGLWTITSCIGNKLIDEINPTNLKGLKREQVITQIKSLIRSYYVFMGYIEFANYVEKLMGDSTNKKDIQRKLKNEFNDRLLVIDEMHNIRVSIEDSKNKIVADKLLLVITNAERMRLLLLTATPMYNNCTEIIWLLNLLNINDRRPTIKLKKVFNEEGELTEEGKDLLVRKMRGYVSYVRGENPYTFPFRIFPKDIPSHTPYESAVNTQMNGRKIKAPTTLDLYVSPIGEEQLKGYAFIMDNLKKAKITIERDDGTTHIMPPFYELDTINYTMLQIPIQALNIVYPGGKIKRDIDLMEFYKPDSSSSSSTSTSTSSSSISLKDVTDVDEEESNSQQSSVSSSKEESTSTSQSGGSAENITGTKGLERVVTFSNGKYTYKSEHDGFFKMDNLGAYSSKMHKICEHILNAIGIVLVYSQYIDGGLIPMALALEELGYKHYTSSLFEPAIHTKKKGTYAMITGDTSNSKEIVNALTNKTNKDGNDIKVILISKSGSEGIDLKFIRQIHIMEPWYNMSRIEQIIGRGVRDGSHKDLPFEHRNVEIYMHATTIPDFPELETADEYIYRFAETKAVRIGQISRLLKENAVDCKLNQEQLNFVEENFPEKIQLELSSGESIADFQVGDKDYTIQCDYDTCMKPEETDPDEEIQMETYNVKFASEASNYIIDAVKSLMEEKHFYTAETLILEINRLGKFAIEQIYVALTKMIEEKIPIYDKYKRQGTLVNVSNYYLFQPIEIENENITLFERMVPIQTKPANIVIKDLVTQEEIAQIGSEDDGYRTLYEMKEMYDAIIESASEKAIRGEKDMTKICGSAIHLLARHELITSENIINLLVEYLVDYLEYKKLVDILNYFTQNNVGIDNTFEGKVHRYLTTKIKTMRGSSFILLYDKNVRKIVMLNDRTNEWELNTEQYMAVIATDALTKQYERIQPKNNIIGFIDYDEEGLSFKTKDTTNKRNSGAKCANAGKVKTIKQINAVIGGNTFNSENTKTVSQTTLCIMQEFLMRQYNVDRPDRRWFFTYEENKFLLINQ